MISDLGLAHNTPSLGLAAAFNHIYQDDVTAIIIIIFSLRHKLNLNVLQYLICSMVKNLRI